VIFLGASIVESKFWQKALRSAYPYMVTTPPAQGPILSLSAFCSAFALCMALGQTRITDPACCCESTHRNCLR
jgi:hypothetical protein